GSGWSVATRQRLVHPYRHDDTRRGSEGGDDPDGGGETEQVGHHPGDECTDGKSSVSPESVHPDGRSTPGGMGHIADGGQEGWVDHGGAGAENEGAEGPWPEAVDSGDEPDGCCLSPHPRGDQPLAADAIGQRAGDELTGAPHRRIEGGENPNSGDGEAPAGEEDREDAPGQPVVQ